MKIVFAGLVCLSVSFSPLAQLPNESRIFKNSEGVIKRYEAAQLKSNSDIDGLGLNEDCDSDSDDCAQLSYLIPEGFGGVSLGSFSGGTQVELTLLRYNIHYSKNGRIPFYLLATTPLAGQVDVDTSISSLLGTDSGLLNLKIADDVITLFSEEGNGDGLCDFKGASDSNLQGGCYINTQMGIKLVEYLGDTGKSKQMGAFYASTQFSFEFPISDESGLTRAGRLAGGLGFSGYYANTDNVKHLFPELADTEGVQVKDLKKFYASFDAGLTFTVTEQFTITASYVKPLVNDDAFDDVVTLSFKYLVD